MSHRGQIVEKLIRKSGYSLTKIAKQLGISRPTLYRKFNEPDLSYPFIANVGHILHHDFTQDFPEFKKEVDLIEDSVSVFGREVESADVKKLKVKYRNLLERYMELLEILVKVANENGLYSFKEAIIQLIDKEPPIDEPEQS